MTALPQSLPLANCARASVIICPTKMKSDKTMRDWIIETINTIAFFLIMALLYVVMVLITGGDPKYW